MQQRGHWLVALIAIVAAGIATLPFSLPFITTASTAVSPLPPSHVGFSYIVLIDGGSSGTRVHVHAYTLPAPPAASSSSSSAFAALPVISPSLSLKVKPGLSAFDSPTRAAASLQPLVAFAMEQVPSHLHSSTPIYLYATGGLRTIPLPEAESILAECRHVLSRTPFAWQPDRVRIISGVQEGINGWIAANYLLRHFDGSEPHSSTIGVLEMGGASLQLTYAPVEPSLFPAGTLIPLQVAQQSYAVYTVSHLNYGLEKAQELYTDKHHHLLVQSDPCYPYGLTSKAGRAVRGHYKDCVRLVDELIRHEIDDDTRETTEARHELGIPDSQQDMWDHTDTTTTSPSSSSALDDAAILRSAPASGNCSAARPCSFSGHPIPPIASAERFLAIENFYYTNEFFSLLPASPHDGWDMQQLKDAGERYCAMGWSDIVTRWPNEPLHDLEKYCFSAAYLPRVLELGLGMGRPDRAEADGGAAEAASGLLHNVVITKTIDGVAIDWALGAVLLEITNHLHADLYQRAEPTASAAVHEL